MIAIENRRAEKMKRVKYKVIIYNKLLIYLFSYRKEVSIHTNAAGNGKQWMSARGWTCYTSRARPPATGSQTASTGPLASLSIHVLIPPRRLVSGRMRCRIMTKRRC